MRLAIVALWLLPTLTFGQAPADDPEKVSNDQPGRPLQMPPASGEVKEALDDFERFQRRGAWERALKALYTIPEEQAHRFIDGDDGFIISVARKRRLLLSALPPAGQAAYRLFYDAEAQKLFDQAEGSSERKNLERIYSAYFPTSVGDNAADRLGDLDFELGRFDHAADCWLAVLRERADTDLSPALLAVKAALALSRAGRTSEYNQIHAELATRYSEEKVTLAGHTATPVELLRRLEQDRPPDTDHSDADSVAARLDLGGLRETGWQVRFGESVTAGMTPPELNQWESNPLSAAVPAVATSGTTLFANYLGYVFAVDLGSGKMLWRSAPFHHAEVPAMQEQVRLLDSTRFAVIASGEYVWSLGRELKEPNVFAPFRLTCRRSDGGDVVWHSADLSDYAQVDLSGPPLLADGKLFIAGKNAANQPQQGPPQMFVLAIRPRDGKLLWRADVGALRQGQRFFYYGVRETEAQPQLAYRAGALYVDTHLGVAAKLDADSGEVDWGYGYATDPAETQYRFFFGSPQRSEPATACSRPVASGESLLIKGVKSGRLCALEPDRMKRLWDRPIAKSARLLGVIDGVAFLGGPEIGAVDLRTRELLWATRVPGGSAEARVLVGRDGLWQLTPRGIFEIDPRSGGVRRIFRGADTGSAGGNLVLTDRLLVAVSNRTISAYPRRGNEDEGPADLKRGTSDE